MKPHLTPVGKPAPPRPRSPESFTVWMIASGSMPSGFGSAWEPVVVELRVPHHHGGVVAGGVALDVLQADLAVRGGLVVGHAEMLAQPGEDLVAAQDGAERVGAHAHVVLADRTALVHRVEAHDRAHLGLGQPEAGGAERDAVVGDEALLGLDQVEQWQQRRPRARVPADDLGSVRVQPGARLAARRYHLSTPPMTGSRLATAAMTSAIMPPSAIAASACRLVNDGSRKCAR